MTQNLATQAGNLPYSMTRDAISVMARGKFKVLPSTSPNFEKVKEALRQPSHDVDLILDLMDISRFVARASLGAVQIADGEVRWNGQKVHGVIVDRILEHLRLGIDLVHLAAFLNRVMQNPLVAAREELFQWLEAGNAPITPDGFFLAFKKVGEGYLDLHTSTIRNAIGDTPSMPRELVDPDRRNECSRGLHFCSHGYLPHFGYGSGNHVMVVKIDPADVVAIPNDYNRQKGRTWRYEVVGEIEQSQAATFFDGRPVVDVQPAENGGAAAVETVGGYKVGDTAVARDHPECWLTAGNGYKVLDIDTSDDTLLVADDDDDETWVNLANFEPKTAEEPEAAAAEETVAGYKVGDMVVYTGEEEGYLTEGKAYRVERLDLDDNSLGVVDDEGDSVWLFLEDDDFAPKPQDGEGSTDEDGDDAELPVPAPGAAQPMFTYGNRSYIADELLSMVKEHGQRGFNRMTGVPRSTLQGWLAKIGG